MAKRLGHISIHSQLVHLATMERGMYHTCRAIATRRKYIDITAVAMYKKGASTKRHRYQPRLSPSRVDTTHHHTRKAHGLKISNRTPHPRFAES